LAANGDPDTGTSWPFPEAENADISLVLVVELLATNTNATGEVELSWPNAVSEDVAEIRKPVASKAKSLGILTKRVIRPHP
jgi:hypothetical protein